MGRAVSVVGDVRRRLWRGYADGRRRIRRSGSAVSAMTIFGEQSRNAPSIWTDITSERHECYRSANPVPPGSVAIVCVSRRPHLLHHFVKNVERQTGFANAIEVVFVANGPGFVEDEVEHALVSIPHALVDHAPTGTSLGRGLNRGMSMTGARFIAKFDDDDFYGSAFLADALRAHSYAGAGVVGKHSYFAHLRSRNETVIRFPSHEFCYSSTLAGGTLVIDRDVVDDQEFPDISLGEDRAFIARCHRRGISTFSADRFNFTQIRDGGNTWRLDDEDFLIGTESVGSGWPESEINR